MRENKTIFDVTIGSLVYGTNTETSDIDTKSIHIANKYDFYTNNISKQINYNKDSTSYELSRFIELLADSNPTCLEMLFTPENHIREIHPSFKILIDNRHKFLSKMCKNTFGGYVRSQIMKATALDKKMNWEKQRILRKDVLEFCYTFYNQGSTKLNNWLEYRGLKQQYCGLVNIPNMHNTYSVFYDLGTHLENEDNIPSLGFLLDFLEIREDICDIEVVKQILNIISDDSTPLHSSLCYSDSNNNIKTIHINKDDPKYANKIKPIGYRGITNMDVESNEVRLSSIPKGLKPICNMVWNKTGYIKHCKDFKEYTIWLNERNTQRYIDTNNHGQMIDGKNLLHCRRLLDIAIEIATKKEIILKRPNAAQLLDIRKGNVKLEEILDIAKKDLELLDDLYNKSDLHDEVDKVFLSEIHYQIRNSFYNTNLK